VGRLRLTWHVVTRVYGWQDWTDAVDRRCMVEEVRGIWAR